jgi:8-oxo-dGTP diphosphatase
LLNRIDLRRADDGAADGSGDVAGKTIEAAGGIVLRKSSGKGSASRAGKLIAVVQRSKDDAWVLPRGKLKRDENPAAAARREVVEETGHRVEVHEYLGAITYRAGRRPKVVQFWRMEAEPEASHELMPDIVAVDWLPLKAAIRRLSYPLEKLFLRHAIARALKKRRVKSAKEKTATGKKKPAKAVKAKKKAALQSSNSKSVSSLASSGKAARAHRELKHRAKAAEAKSKNKTKNKAKNKAKGKTKNKDKFAKADRKAAKTKKAKSKKTKGKKSKRGGSRHGVEIPAAVAQAPAAVKPVAAVPARIAAAPHASERNGAPRKTILQRVLGRLSG